MSSQRPAEDTRIATVYEIRVEGQLDGWWRGWFDEALTLTCQTDGTTTIVGPVVDQAALYGLLIQLRDGGMTLISLHRKGN